ncbi:hypothetical protein GCM10027398_10140 [Azotobacter salinestris]
MPSLFRFPHLKSQIAHQRPDTPFQALRAALELQVHEQEPIEAAMLASIVHRMKIAGKTLRAAGLRARGHGSQAPKHQAPFSL